MSSKGYGIFYMEFGHCLLARKLNFACVAVPCAALVMCQPTSALQPPAAANSIHMFWQSYICHRLQFVAPIITVVLK